jgi:hypothetical protein
MSAQSMPMPGFVLAAMMALVLAAVPVCAKASSQQAGGASGGIYDWYELAPGESAEWVFTH